MSDPLRIHADRAYLPAGEPHIPMLWPFWGRADVTMPRPDLFDRYIERAPELFEPAGLDDADVAIFPQDWKRGEVSTPDTLEPRAQAFADEARAAGKPYVIFRGGDSSDALPIEGATVVRHSLQRSTRPPRDQAFPGFHEDLLEYTGGRLPERAKGNGRPVVGFCGMVIAPPPPGIADRLRRLLGRTPSPDRFVRAEAIDTLRRQDSVETSFVIRDDWGGGAYLAEPPFVDTDRWRRVRQEFVDNAVASDYVLCTRGHGNYSYRLYESLSLGRIPVFVDTDCVLPLDTAVDWRDYCVWVDRFELPLIGEKVAEFHERLSPAEFVERQHACRKLWETYLTPEGFFSHFRLLLQ